MIRKAVAEDVPQIQEIEGDYYEGFECPTEVLEAWIETGKFFVLEKENRIEGFLFLEPVGEVKALPWMHPPLEEGGRMLYVSEVGARGWDSDVVQRLLERVLEELGGEHEGVVWLTGGDGKHDLLERKIIEDNGFVKWGDVESWECSPGMFVSDHSLYLKKL